jgi:hypothetical protein
MTRPEELGVKALVTYDPRLESKGWVSQMGQTGRCTLGGKPAIQRLER